MPRPIVAQIHPGAVSRNLSLVKQRASRSRAWAVVKANAYGHGIDRVFPALANADGIALLDLDEAVRVRELGWTKPILLLEGVFKPDDVQIAQQFDLSMAVHCREQLDLLRLSSSRNRVNVHLKMNSGMNRLGFRPDAYRAAWEEARSIPVIADITLMSHFANADDGDVAWQTDRFDAVTQDIPGQRSLANSAAVLWHPQAHRDWVRPGVVLYGGSPTGQSRHIDDVDLRASMTLRSEVIGVQSLSAQETVGYGRAFAANREMRIGVVACGYADGYPRHASTGTPIAVDGVMTQVVGRVSMDMLTVDLTPCPHAQIGSKVELWGEQVKIDDVAHASGTIGYELMCALAKRVPVEVV